MPSAPSGQGLHVEPLAKSHDRRRFSCGIDALDRYLHSQAGQDSRRRLAAPYVLVEGDGDTILGYYTLSQTSIEPSAMPAEIVRKLPRYPLLPATLLGRLAIAVEAQGHGLGEYLLLDSMRRCLGISQDIASFALVVEAKDDRARGFYEKLSFIEFPERPYRLFLPMPTVAQLLAR